ncbi:MAG: DUF1127 domain-containing protein [Gammaproteobacteria bacterium]|nr:DUF1127 domain-containing protein [Gammaproteobacteria bacterium]NIM73641.1 DUF1127 domain-containing protein [Gammaproteobacteria bacterium]NIN40295.1 DUF1127 domain-containing protein [Gammaproteobacteria bacterium]NIO25458.1 DUF1127 domain-containing protein [Gammaproteobacteria bacterium]NIO66135.1 DUF1127 domain-containing protein [Gammaproteobacteria bacterium]
MSNLHVETLHRPVFGAGFGHPLKRLYAVVTTWQQRFRLRQHLLTLDDRLLEDMGLDRAAAVREAAKPLWRE